MQLTFCLLENRRKSSKFKKMHEHRELLSLAEQVMNLHFLIALLALTLERSEIKVIITLAIFHQIVVSINNAT